MLLGGDLLVVDVGISVIREMMLIKDNLRVLLLFVYLLSLLFWFIIAVIFSPSAPMIIIENCWMNDRLSVGCSQSVRVGLVASNCGGKRCRSGCWRPWARARKPSGYHCNPTLFGGARWGMAGFISLVQCSGWCWMKGNQILYVRLLVDGILAGLHEQGCGGLILFCLICLEPVSGQNRKIRTFSNLGGLNLCTVPASFGFWLFSWSKCDWIVKKEAENIPRPCRPTLWNKLGQVEQGQAPSWV